MPIITPYPPIFTGTNPGLVPTSDSDPAKFLSADGSFLVPSGGGGGGGDYTEIEYSGAVGAATIVIDNIPDTYADLIWSISNLRHNDAGNATFSLAVSDDNGGTWSPEMDVTGAISNAAFMTGAIEMLGYKLQASGVSANLADLSAGPPNLAESFGPLGSRYLIGPINAIRLTTSADVFVGGDTWLYGK